MSDVQVDRDGAVLVVTLSRPDRLNALTNAMLQELAWVWEQAADPAVRGVVVTGAGRGFCAGADLQAGAPAAGADGAEARTPRSLRHTFNPQITALFALDKPVIAAVNGAVAGAGLALALAADLRIASQSAKFVPAFAAIGLIPDSGVTFLLPRIVGSVKALRWLTDGTRLTAADAAEFGLIDEVTTPEALLDTALAHAHRLAAVPGAAYGLTKAALNRLDCRRLAEQLEIEVALQGQAVSAPGRAEARAAVVAAMKKGS